MVTNENCPLTVIAGDPKPCQGCKFLAENHECLLAEIVEKESFILGKKAMEYARR